MAMRTARPAVKPTAAATVEAPLYRLDGFALAGDLDLEAAGDVAVALVGDGGSELHGDLAGSIAARAGRRITSARAARSGDFTPWSLPTAPGGRRQHRTESWQTTYPSL
jgi:hypothetical protein